MTIILELVGIQERNAIQHKTPIELLKKERAMLKRHCSLLTWYINRDVVFLP
jgi:hypothetical protein